MKYVPATLGGRGRTGSDSSGTIYHAVRARNGAPNYCLHPALCGKSPGRRSIGWYAPDGQTVTCPKCLKKLSATPTLAEMDDMYNACRENDAIGADESARPWMY